MSRPRGCVIKRAPRSWWVVLSAKDETGKRVRRWHGPYPTKEEAERDRTRNLVGMDTATYVAPSKLTVEQFLIEHWLPAVEASLRLSTFRRYETDCRIYLVPRIGNHRLQALQPDVLNRLYHRLLREGGRDGRKLSARTVRHCHRTIRKALQDALRWGYVVRNVADAANPPGDTDKPEMSVWSAQELRTFLGYVADDRLRPMWLTFASTGMRRGEVLGLRWQDVDLEAGRLAIRQTLLAVGHALSYSEPKTKRGRRLVSLDPVTWSALREHRKRQLEERMAFGLGQPEPGSLVFTNEIGKPIHPDRVTKLFGRLAQEAGLPRIRLHDLRHGWATLAFQAGEHPKAVSEQLGHSTVSLTLDTYTHAIPAMQQEMAERVARLIHGS
jgi:integrase